MDAGLWVLQLQNNEGINEKKKTVGEEAVRTLERKFGGYHSILVAWRWVEQYQRGSCMNIVAFWWQYGGCYYNLVTMWWVEHHQRGSLVDSAAPWWHWRVKQHQRGTFMGHTALWC